MDFVALATLPRRHFVNGLAEAIKAGLIADPELFALFECEHPEENIERIIYRSLRVKKNVVENDEHEQGQRACLNFGQDVYKRQIFRCGIGIHQQGGRLCPLAKAP